MRTFNRASWVLVCALLALGGCSGSKEGAEEAARLGPNGGPGDSASAGASGQSSGAAGTSAGTGAFSNASGGNGGGAAPLLGGAAGAGGSFGAADESFSPPPSNEGDAYTSVGVNPFVLVAHDPFSTFAADVDTASYDLMRRDVNLGIAPVADGVRLEDYVNYFVYDYVAPTAESEHPFAISLAAATHPVRPDTTLLRVGIQARKPAPFEKKPANLVFLIDTSGSMQSEEKLPLVQRVLTQALSVLDPNDSVSIVTYASGTRVALEPTRVLESATIAAAINGLSAGGSTNGAGGIQLAYEQAQAAFIQDGINHVVLCTDGDFNVGASSDAALVELIVEKRQTGITLTALGFGIGNLNDSMMEKVSNAGNGMYSVISSQTQADSYAEDRLLATLEHVAKDVKIQLELNPEHVLAYRLLGYENRAIADDQFRDDAIDAGEIGAGHRVTALYELVMTGGAVPNVQEAPEVEDGEPVEGAREIDAADLVLVKVRYKQPGATEQDAAVELQDTLSPDLALGQIQAADADMQWAAAMVVFAEVLKGSPYATATDLDAIAPIVTAQQDRDASRTEFADLFARYRSIAP